jgi:hypothetical protein
MRFEASELIDRRAVPKVWGQVDAAAAEAQFCDVLID